MNIYMIAGPPGVGKSTNAEQLVPPNVPIIDQDLAAYQYKKNGFSDYQDLASLSTNQRIKDSLFGKEDFALELNLGFQSHYDYLKSIASFDRTNKIQLLLFFTDNIDLCLNRAKARHVSGGHEVKPEVIMEMYNSTIPLFKQNETLFSTVRLIDVTSEALTEPQQNSDSLPHWIVDNDMQRYLSTLKQSPKPKRGPRPG